MKPGYSKCLLAVSLLLTSCAGTGPHVDESTAHCDQLFDKRDRVTRQAADFDPRFARIRGFPYLRVDRFHAALGDSLNDGRQRRQWIEALAELDSRARRLEADWIRGVSSAPASNSALDDCRARLVASDLADPVRFELLRERARVPDDYSLLARTFGLYPLALPFLKLGVSRYQSETENRLKAFAENASAPWSATAHVYTAPPAQALPGGVFGSLKDNPLQIPAPDKEWRERLLRAYAPTFVVHGSAAADRPVTPQRSDGRLVFGNEAAVVYADVSYARVGQRNLLQLVYTIWFPSRPATGVLDMLAGRLDGVVWRVTLDEQGQPLVFDSVHACGCYHVVFPVAKAVATPGSPWWRESILVAPVVEEPGLRPEVHLAPGTHYVMGVRPAPDDPPEPAQAYHLKAFDSLLRASSSREMLFDVDELVSGSERPERWFLWVSGVRSPGAMRSPGRRAIAFVGRRHFDEPGLLSEFID